MSPHAESVRLEWAALDEVADWDLHPGFRESLPDLRLPRIALLVDAANVVGSRPDGWWRDRAGATQRLLDRLESRAGQVVAYEGRPHLLASVDVVVEGRAREVPERPLDALVRVLRASGSGDDTVAERGRTIADVLVVTSDRGLRARVSRSAPVSQLWEWLD